MVGRVRARHFPSEAATGDQPECGAIVGNFRADTSSWSEEFGHVISHRKLLPIIGPNAVQLSEYFLRIMFCVRFPKRFHNMADAIFLASDY